MKNRKGSVKAMNAEWKRLRDQKVWDESVVREWSEIASTARKKNQKVHLAQLFGFCVLNNPLKSGVNYGTFFGETDQNIKLRGECTVQRAKWYQR